MYKNGGNKFLERVYTILAFFLGGALPERVTGYKTQGFYLSLSFIHVTNGFVFFPGKMFVSIGLFIFFNSGVVSKKEWQGNVCRFNLIKC